MINYRQACPCLFPVRWCCVPGSSPGGAVPQAFIAVLRRLYRQTVSSTAQAVKRHTGAKYKRKRHKNSLYIDNYIIWCYALGNYKPFKGV